VFRVSHPESHHTLALKVVLTERPADVSSEYEHMVAAVASGAPMLPPVLGSLRVITASDASDGAYLLQRVGSPFVVKSQKRCLKAFQALAALHSFGVIHGDARLPNLIVADKAIVWIDLHMSSHRTSAEDVACGPLMRRDAETLARSLLKLERSRDTTLPVCVSDAVMGYDESDEKTVRDIAAAVWRSNNADVIRR